MHHIELFPIFHHVSNFINNLLLFLSPNWISFCQSLVELFATVKAFVTNPSTKFFMCIKKPILIFIMSKIVINLRKTFIFKSLFYLDCKFQDVVFLFIQSSNYLRPDLYTESNRIFNTVFGLSAKKYSPVSEIKNYCGIV